VNRSVTRLALAVLLALAMLSMGLTYHQAIRGPSYREDLRNPRALLDRTQRERGRIITADGVVVARSEPAGDDPGIFVRVYPEEALYSHTVGYSSSVFGDTGVEKTRRDDLRSHDDGSLTSALISLFGQDLSPDDVRLTIDDHLQRAAAAALGDQRGAVVVIDPATGAVLAMVSSPSFDPNLLAGDSVTDGESLSSDASRPLLNRATAENYPAGSSFKVVVTAAAMEAGGLTPDSRLPDARELALPGSTSIIRNAGGEFCGDGHTLTLERALVVSCNTAFADLGMSLGAEALVGAAEAAGFNNEIPFELGAALSTIPSASQLHNDLPALAQTALGQRDLRATPLEMALIAASVANGGVIMRPYLVDGITDAEGGFLRTTTPAPWLRAMKETTASALASMMEKVVASGTGSRAAVSGLTVGGKTGTAEGPGGAPDVWFIGFARDPHNNDRPQIALAVLVEAGGDRGTEGSGATVAAPIAKTVIEAWFGS
jgi:peptidoglycan glycosyltransferase